MSPRGFTDEDEPRKSRDKTPCTLGHAVGLRATAMAVLVRRGGRELWIPQSCIHEDSEVYGEGHTGKLVVFEWWARTKGLVK